MVALERSFHQGRQIAARPLGGRWKRAMDLVLGVSALIVFLPVLLMIGLMVKVQDAGPILFVQQRIGFGGAPFSFLKFRSMAPDAELLLAEILATDPQAAREWREKQKLAHDPRVTPIGRILRRTSLDELPQLVNVVAGQMSMVGPRPMLEQQIGEYGERFRLYCLARPGLTGLWQVSGRNRLSFSQRAELDEAYLRRWSPAGDLVLLARTAGAVIAGGGAA